MRFAVYPGRKTLLCATMLAGLPAGWGALAATPFGVYLSVDTSDTGQTSQITTTSDISPLFGTVSCLGTGSAYHCTGGATGIFLSAPWNHFENTIKIAAGPSVVTEVAVDPYGEVSSLMSSIASIESSTFKFQMTIGLKSGVNAAYDVLDMYAAASGAPSGSAPNYYTSLPITTDSVEGQCNYNYSGNTVVGGGNTFGTNGFPEQCELRNDGNKDQCLNEPRIWGNDATSMAANGYYIKAFSRAQQDLANFVTGLNGYGGSIQHQFQNLKISGIGGYDEETGLAGNPKLNIPTIVSNGITSTVICGDANATNAEEIWTKQASGGIYALQSATLESTWATLVAASTSVTNSLGGSPFYMIDVILEANFPPLQPAHCSTATTPCSYTGPTDPLLPALTTGEMEYLIYQSLSTGELSAGNLSVQDQGLEQYQPDSDPSVESNYGTIEIPCAMNALVGTAIGYQSGGTPMVTSADKVAYLASIANAAAYGAQYVELKPDVLQSFVDNLSPVTFGTLTAYGTSKTQNITLLSSTIGNALVTMAANRANVASGTLCPKPAGIPPYPGVWTYPGQTF